MIIPMNETLRAEEIEELLVRITGDDYRDLDDEQHSDGIKSYNLASQERIIRGRMPTLEVIHERFARELRMGLFNFMRKAPEISTNAVKMIKYTEFIRNLVVPTSLNIFTIKPLRGKGLLVLEPGLIYGIVDYLFGGDGRRMAKTDGREFTETESKIIARLLDVIFTQYAKAWQPVYPHLEVKFDRHEAHTQFANIATQSEIVVSASFNIELGNIGGHIHICLPYSSIEPIRDLLNSNMQTDASELDARWVNLLKGQMNEVNVQFESTLGTARLKVQDVVNLEVGDVIPLDVGEQLVARVNNVPIFEGTHGVKNGKYAFRVNKLLQPQTVNAEKELLKVLESNQTVALPGMQKVDEEDNLLARLVADQIKHESLIAK